MLVLTRELGEKIHIGRDVVVTVVDIDRGKIRLGIEAPDNVTILREELLPDRRFRVDPAHPPAPEEDDTAELPTEGRP